MGTVQRHSFTTPHGRPVLFMVRDQRDANGQGFSTSDWNTVNASAAPHDEYGIPSGLTGWVLDVGAHIGSVVVMLLVDNPDARAVAIEALPENVQLLHENLRLNGVEDRCLVLMAAASDSAAPVRIGYGDVADPTGIHEYIGNSSAPPGSREIVMPGVTLRGAMLQRGVAQDEPFEWVKIDCEGCEYPFLSSPHASAMRWVTGEYHFGYERVEHVLSATHDVRRIDESEKADGVGFGHFVAVVKPLGS